ncbi:unnamed protein product, partial [Microthlaspi erraticum]
VAVASPYLPPNWVVDSGATHHINSDLHNLSLHQPYNSGDDVILADGSTVPITHTGSVSLPSQTRDLTLNKVLCLARVAKNLISVYQLCNANRVSVEFFPASFQVKDLHTGVPLIRGRTNKELYEWPVSLLKTAFGASTNPTTTLSSWHNRLGHPSSSILNNIVSSFSLPVASSSQSKMSCSIAASIKVTSYHSRKQLLHQPDHLKFSSQIYTWLYPLKRKSQVKETFMAFKPLVENKFQTRIGTFFTDNGGEFKALRDYLKTSGISHLTSPPHTPEHNGVSERKHRHIVEMGLTLLSTAAVPKKFWPFAFSTAVYLINRLPTPVLDLQSPFEKLFGMQPNYHKLKVFGCVCYPWLRPYTRHKMEDRSLQCVFMGYSTTQSAYLCLHTPSGRMYTSRHVIFDENQFPFSVNLKPDNMSPDEEDATVATGSLIIQPLLPSPVLPPPTDPCVDLHHNAPPPPPSLNQVLPYLPNSSVSPHTSSKPTASTEKGPQPTTQPQPPTNNTSPNVPQTATTYQAQAQQLNPTEYRRVVGSLQYLAFTLPDLLYAVNRLSLFMHKPTTNHWQAVKRVLQYLAGTAAHGIFLPKNNPMTLHAFSDADWGGDSDDYVSTNAHIVYLRSQPVSWSSKEQRGVARSSTEAEYMSVANTSVELIWIVSLLQELHIQLPTVPVIYCDNAGATYLCANPVFHSRMKHLALDYHFI